MSKHDTRILGRILAVEELDSVSGARCTLPDNDTSCLETTVTADSGTTSDSGTTADSGTTSDSGTSADTAPMLDTKPVFDAVIGI